MDTPPTLQYGFSASNQEASFNQTGRRRKSAKVLAILEDTIGNTGNMNLLDIGCSTGFMSRMYAEKFKEVVAVDIDAPAISFAKENNGAKNLSFLEMDSQSLAFADQSFDAVTCTHIYEHVPDAKRLMKEIRRVLKSGGVCFFSAGNRLSLMEPHYRLPLLSVMPKWLAHGYLRVLRRGNFYYETHLTYWSLKQLVRDFEVIDYTVEVLRNPVKFSAEDMITPGSKKQRVVLAILTMFYWICPTYLWVLRKPRAQKQ